MKNFNKIENVDHTALTNTDEQRANLLTLANHLAALPTDYGHFNMSYYFFAVEADTPEVREKFREEDRYFRLASDFHNFPAEHIGYEVHLKENSFEERIGKCGAVACAIGHGPLAGIKENPEIDSDWDDYASRVFGYSISDNGSFFFGGYWSSYNNTASGAADRIFYALQHGIPDEWDNTDNSVYRRFHDELTEVVAE